MLRNSDGIVYAGTSAGLFRYNGSSSWTNVSDDFASISVFDMIAGVDSCVYADGFEFGSTYASVWKYCNGTWTDLSRGLASTEASGIVQISDGSLYFAGFVDPQARVWKYNGGSWSEVTGSLNLTGIGSLLKVDDNLLITAGSLGNYAGVWTYASGAWTDKTGVLDGAWVDTLLHTADGSTFAGGYKTKTGISAGNYARVWAYTDTTAPVTSISPAGKSYKTSQTVTLSAADDLSGVRAIYYSTNGEKPRQKNKYKYTKPFSVDSNLTVKYFAVDNKSNKEKVKTAKFKIKQAVWRMNNVKKKKNLIANGVTFNFSKLKKKLKKSKYYLKSRQYNTYGSGLTTSRFLKRYILIKTNLAKTKFDGKFKIRMTFSWTDVLLRNTGINESNLKLYYKTSGGWAKTAATLSTRNNTLQITWTAFPAKEIYFTVGL